MDRQQFDLLRQGWSAWNAWRRDHPEIRPDLSEADCSYSDLRGADLQGTDLWARTCGVLTSGMPI